MSEDVSDLTACERCQLELDAVLLGIADAETERSVRVHLAACPGCQRQAAALLASMNELLYVQPVPLPADARNVLLQRARQTPLEGASKPAEWPGQARAPSSQPPRRPVPAESRGRIREDRTRRRSWLVAGLSLAAAIGFFLARPNVGPDIRQADVVVSAGSSVVMARSETSHYPLVIRTSSGQLHGIRLAQAKPAWYTEGVYHRGKAYLLDAANERLVVLNVAQRKVERTYSTPGGAAGLAVNDERIVVKSAASGQLRTFEQDSSAVTSLALPAPMPQADYMDAVLMEPGRLLTTQHTRGEVIALSVDGRRILARYRIGGAPVGLQDWKRHVLVLDVQGRLLELGPAGQILRSVKVPGHPDKFNVMGDHAYLTDRGGQVSEVDLVGFTLTKQRTFGKPMDIVALPDGHLALADAKKGLILLNPDLSVL